VSIPSAVFPFLSPDSRRIESPQRRVRLKITLEMIGEERRDVGDEKRRAQRYLFAFICAARLRETKFVTLQR
jgi:hypothetical protein